jgi:glycyl-tRNA synthetase beta chain
MATNRETFILELYSEEVPARFQPTLEALAKQHWQAISATFDLECSALEVFSTPHRLVLQCILPTTTSSYTIEKRGPREGASKQALEGFVKGLDCSINDLKLQETAKGKFYFFQQQKVGEAVTHLLPDIITKLISAITLPKTMAWADYDVKWVRPLRNILALMGRNTIIGEYKLSNSRCLKFNNKIYYDHHEKFLEINHADDYHDSINSLGIIVSRLARQDIIIASLPDSYQKQIDHQLLQEVIGLVEKPHVLTGSIDQKMQALPRELLITTMASHQKYFPRIDNGEINGFYMVANQKNDEDLIISGNEKVLHARLNDAKFFYENDCKKSFSDLNAKLDNIMVHKDIGTVSEQVTNIIAIITTHIKVANIFPQQDIDHAIEAAKISKADLASEVVAEFPELQGVMGYYYAKINGMNEAIALAIKNQYDYEGSISDNASIILAIANKLEQLTSFFNADLRPTGSKDPFALRRAALGLIKTIYHNNITLDLGIKNQELLAFLQDRLAIFLKEKLSLNNQKLISALMANNSINQIPQFINQLEEQDDFFTNNGIVAKSYKRAKNIIKKCHNLPDYDHLLSTTTNEKEVYLHAMRVKKLTDTVALAHKILTFLDTTRVDVDDIQLQNNRRALLKFACNVMNNNFNFDRFL